MGSKYIAFTGGKGGTGKSTIAVNIAVMLARTRDVVLADVDVECPNDYLLLSIGELGNREDVSIFYPKFDLNNCTKCGACKEACAENAIVQFENGYPFLLPQLCSGCRTCQIVCPEDAIKDGHKVVGATYLNDAMNPPDAPSFTLVTGVLREGEERSFPVAKATTERGLAQKADIYIFDTAAGTTNTVAEPLLQVQAIFAVTEPTPLGIHDLQMILSLADKVGIKKRYIIINKADMGGKDEYRELEGIGESNGGEIIARIPYRRDVVESYVKGHPYVAMADADRDVLEEFQRIVEVIQ